MHEPGEESMNADVIATLIIAAAICIPFIGACIESLISGRDDQ